MVGARERRVYTIELAQCNNRDAVITWVEFAVRG